MRLGRVAVVLLLLAAGAAVVLSRLPLCPSALFLGVPCPGCGLTRATLLLLTGDFPGALRLHPLSPVLAPLCAALVGTALVRYVAPERARVFAPFPARVVTPVAWALFALVLGVWGARFFGAFGGPATVTSLSALYSSGSLAEIVGERTRLGIKR